MKKNTKTYVLIAAVLGIWGAIGYQIVNGLNPSQPDIVQDNFNITFNPKEHKAVDTFSVQKVNRDPFLGTLTRRKSASKSGTKKNTPKQMKWAPISYHGLVKRQNSSQQVFVVTVNNKQHLLKKGQTIDSITLIKGSAKSIVVSYKNKQKTITSQ